ncbi:amino acid permease [uncultured Clostridium sp.]|jgi:APA family basic amino acid/polyamine antiporter|uniref:APC family permease n=1 Tax=uncultured Clostridium sp. TaxID=59620 RepID=UPI002630C695|nr:amino acid permease [uncultured Clostridium sp.]
MGHNELKKTVSFWAAFSTVIGLVIGSGVFFKPQAIFQSTGGAPGLGIIAWILGGIITIAAGLTATEISAAFPETGGMMIYMREIYGQKLSYLTAWMQTILYFPAVIAALAILFSEQACELLDMPHLKIPIAIGVILLLVLVNLIGSKTSGLIQIVSTIGKLIPIALIIIVGLFKHPSTGNIMTPMIGHNINFTTALGQVLVASLFAYDGWIYVGNIAGEMKNPSKDLPKAIIGGLMLVMAVYVIINVVFVMVVPASEIAASATPASIVAQKLFGDMGAKIIDIGILVSIFGTLNGYTLTAPRVPFALAKTGYLPFSKTFSKLNKANVPANATWLMAILGILYALSGQFNLLSNLTIFTIWIFYSLIFIGVFKLRKQRPEMNRPYKVIGYPVIPIIAILGGLFVVINQLFMSGIQSSIIALSGVVITLIGFPIYFYMDKKLKNNK